MQPLNTQRLAKRFSCVYWRGGWQAGCNHTLRPREQRASSVRCSHLGTSESVCLASDHTTMCRPECGGASAKARCRCRRIGLVVLQSKHFSHSLTHQNDATPPPSCPYHPYASQGYRTADAKRFKMRIGPRYKCVLFPFSFKSLFLPHLLSPPSPSFPPLFFFIACTTGLPCSLLSIASLNVPPPSPPTPLVCPPSSSPSPSLSLFAIHFK